MVVLEDREERNKIRRVINKAQDFEVLTKEEIGFVVTLVERFRSDIERKVKQLNVLQGEISQLRDNEAIIIDLIDNMSKAAERDIARQETAKKIRETRIKNTDSINTES